MTIWIDLKLSMRLLKRIHLLSLKKQISLTQPSKPTPATAESPIAPKNIVTVFGGVKSVEVNATALTVIIVRIIREDKRALTLSPKRSLRQSEFYIFFILIIKKAYCTHCSQIKSISKNHKIMGLSLNDS